jgi:hypothetical protein
VDDEDEEAGRAHQDSHQSMLCCHHYTVTSQLGRLSLWTRSLYTHTIPNIPRSCQRDCSDISGVESGTVPVFFFSLFFSFLYCCGKGSAGSVASERTAFEHMQHAGFIHTDRVTSASYPQKGSFYAGPIVTLVRLSDFHEASASDSGMNNSFAQRHVPQR